MHKRAVEYLLNLDATDIAAKRLEIEEKEQELGRKWSAVIGGIKAITKSIGGVAQKVPSKPVAIWPPQIPPALMMPNDEDWIPLDQKRRKLRLRLEAIEEQEIPRVAEFVETAETELKDAQNQLNTQQAVLSRLLEIYEVEKSEVSGIEERLRKIEEDLQRNKDTRTLLNLGSTAISNIVNHHCPTCHQQILDSLTPLAEGQAVMSIEENIKFLNEQRRTFKGLLANQKNAVEARERQVTALRMTVSELRRKIRFLKETLVSDGRIPSVAAVHERVQLQERLDRLNRAADEFATELEELDKLSSQWNTLQMEKNNLPSDDTSDKDRKKIARWSSLIQEQLRQYDFKSLDISQVAVADETYRPLHEGFDLPTNISASDFIRVIWSYLNGLRELDLEFETNHPGLLVFDEPRQQSAKDLSFEQLLKRAARSEEAGHQVIFATSEKEDVLKRMLEDVPHTYQSFDGHIIRPISFLRSEQE